MLTYVLSVLNTYIGGNTLDYIRHICTDVLQISSEHLNTGSSRARLRVCVFASAPKTPGYGNPTKSTDEL